MNNLGITLLIVVYGCIIIVTLAVAGFLTFRAIKRRIVEANRKRRRKHLRVIK